MNGAMVAQVKMLQLSTKRVVARQSISVIFYRTYSLRLVRQQHTASWKDPSISDIKKLSLTTDDINKDLQSSTTITVSGSTHTVRHQKVASFLDISDGTSAEKLNVVLSPRQAKGLLTGTQVKVTGKWQRAPARAAQKYELHAEHVDIIGASDETYPIQAKFHTSQFLRNIPHLRLRTAFNAALARLRSEAEFHLTSFYRAHGFIKVQTPIITSSDCEGAGEVFSVSAAGDRSGDDATPDQFFRQAKFLTVSAQLHLEAYVHEHPRVWTLSPSFRAEKSDTPRHLSEFWMLEAEVRTTSLNDLMSLCQQSIGAVVRGLWKDKMYSDLVTVSRTTKTAAESRNANTSGPGDDQGNLQSRWEGLMTEQDWPRVSYTDAIARLQLAEEKHTGPDALFEQAPRWEDGLSLEHERWLAAQSAPLPLFITHYPRVLKPFYMRVTDSSKDSSADGLSENSNDSSKDSSTRLTEKVDCFDLLLPEAAEVAGGSLREERYGELIDAMRACGMHAGAQDGLEWYLSLRKWGSVPHGGFGVGWDRLLGYLAGVGNVKDVVAWPRVCGRCDC